MFDTFWLAQQDQPYDSFCQEVPPGNNDQIFQEGSLDPNATRVVFTLAPFADPLFPNLRSLFWRDFTIVPVHAIVPSLTALHLDFNSFADGKPPPMEFLDAVRERCRYTKHLHVPWSPSGPFDAAISRQVCWWTSLQSFSCPWVTLGTDAVLHLSSVPTLTHLSFIPSSDLSNHLSHFGSILTFPNLASLQINSASLKSVTQFFSYIRLPRIMDLDVCFSHDARKYDIQAYWAAVEQACPSSTLRYLTLVFRNHESESQSHQQLTLDDLPFYKTFRDLHGISIDLPWSVGLTDADLLDLVYESPNLIELAINGDWEWRLGDDGGGVTLDGLVELLRYCPSLDTMSLAIDTRTFTHIPQGLDVWFPPEMMPDFLDSHISLECVPRLASVFIALKLGPWSFRASADGTHSFEEVQLVNNLWDNVRHAMLNES